MTKSGCHLKCNPELEFFSLRVFEFHSPSHRLSHTNVLIPVPRLRPGMIASSVSLGNHIGPPPTATSCIHGPDVGISVSILSGIHGYILLAFIGSRASHMLFSILSISETIALSDCATTFFALLQCVQRSLACLQSLVRSTLFL